jgi:flavodoxin
MNTLVVYYSKFGNTQQLAEAIAGRLQSAGSARLVSADELTPSDLSAADLVVFGSPTHKMNLPEPLRPILARLPRRTLKGKSVAAFDTSYRMSSWLLPFTAAHRLAPKLRRLGGKLVVKPETFYVTGREGPLEDHELERGQSWAVQILEKTQPERPQTPKVRAA